MATLPHASGDEPPGSQLKEQREQEQCTQRACGCGSEEGTTDRHEGKRENTPSTAKEERSCSSSSEDDEESQDEEGMRVPRLKRRRVELMLQELESIRAGTTVFSPLFCCTCPSLPNDSLVSPIVSTPCQWAQTPRTEDSTTACQKECKQKEEQKHDEAGKPRQCWTQLRATVARPESEPALSTTPAPIPQTPASAPVSPMGEVPPPAQRAAGPNHNERHETL